MFFIICWQEHLSDFSTTFFKIYCFCYRKSLTKTYLLNIVYCIYQILLNLTMLFVFSATALFYATIIIGISCINALNPILINLACELAYPVGEGTTAFLVNLSTNVLILIVLLIMMIPNIGKRPRVYLFFLCTHHLCLQHELISAII